MERRQRPMHAGLHPAAAHSNSGAHAALRTGRGGRSNTKWWPDRTQHGGFCNRVPRTKVVQHLQGAEPAALTGFPRLRMSGFRIETAKFTGDMPQLITAGS
jgi:hypothetical protein